MSNFKVGDKVVAVREFPGQLTRGKEYTILSIPYDHWHRVRTDNGLVDGFSANAFKLEADDPLPPAPDSALYYNSTRRVDNFQHMLVQPHWELDGHLSIAIVKSGKKFDPLAYGDILSINLEPDAALQLAHDLRRMAMSVKREQK
ncbi:hypothetical protein [Klebsiella phage 1 TK-2018]|uniref:Uncharacterized protein n=1 Tax=Klebsiella phage 1 TK-2018 TaxID=2489637 RepID=A0A5K7NKE8_9CAUD|nr:hypothetical protein [Klebsiella phage 1 TK-2018]